MRKYLASTTIAASLIGAGFGAVALAPTFATAQDDSTGDSATAESATADTAGSDTERGSWIADALAGLIADGTITQDQADAVVEAIQDARPERGDRGFGHQGGFGSDVLEELGLDPEVVREGLAAGQTLGEVAEANGVTAEALTQAIVDHMTERLDAAVAEGHLTQAEADEKAAEIAERAAALVAGEADFGGHRGPGRGFGHHRGEDADSTEESGA